MSNQHFNTPKSLEDFASSAYTQVFELLHTGIALLSNEGNFLYMNKPFMDMFSLAPDTIGRHVSEYFLTSEQGVMTTIRTRKMTICSSITKSNAQGVSFRYPVLDTQGELIGVIIESISTSIGKDKLLKLLETVRNLEEQADYLERRPHKKQGMLYTFDSIVGESKAMLTMKERGRRFARSNEPILLVGESGTGKELIAEALHSASERSDKPFVTVNCAALPPELIESELFGYEGGAFTGAKTGGMKGKFELANNGTIFLDEIGEIPMHVQAKLLRVLESGEIQKIAHAGRLHSDFRLIAATNRDLKKEVTVGNFREDLFYRLNVVHLVLAPLRERLDDLPLLADHFLKLYGEESGMGAKTISRDALRLMFAYSWPGNIRELGNVIERGVVLSSGPEILPSDLPDDIRHPAPTGSALSTGPGVTPPRQASGPRGNGFARPVPERAAPARDDLAEGPDQNGAGSSPWVVEALDLLPEGITLDEAVSALEEGLIRTALDARGGVQSHAAQDLGLKKNVFKYKWDKYVDREPTALSALLATEPPPGLGLVDALETLEEAMLRKALEESRGVQSQAADLLGIKKNLMQYKLKKFNINPKDS